ncbi:hypothetical protein LIER_41381 [Lithospermum erythrorhizon]|uniref:Uncharacterized protein n=1 Tax=Lithospermum erythrorhizon TaxID=34254 RepID=A0AAV3RAH8_LITER
MDKCLDLNFIGKLHQTVVKTVWLIMVNPEGHTEEKAKLAFFWGVCIGSKGFILTVAKEIVDDVDWTTFCGRTRDLTMFKDLREYWSDKDLGLKIYKVDEDDAEYDYVDVSDL